MEWDLGLQGVGVLVLMAAVFGVVAYVFFGRHTAWWLGPLGAATFFVMGLFTSEIWFGWATEEDLQPNYDGLSFDEVLLAGTMMSLVVVGVARYLLTHDRHRTPHHRHA